MDLATALSVVQTLLTALQCTQLIDFCSKRSLSSELDHLRVTVKRIQGVLVGEKEALCTAEGGVRLSKAQEFSFFPSLQTLILSHVPEMKGWWRGVGIGDDHQLLRLPKLKLSSLPQLVNLPNWIQYLTALQILDIYDCKQLKSLPNWMSKLTSLVELSVIESSEGLEERCAKSTGEDWPHIQHISSSIIKDKDTW